MYFLIQSNKPWSDVLENERSILVFLYWMRYTYAVLFDKPAPGIVTSMLIVCSRVPWPTNKRIPLFITSVFHLLFQVLAQ